MQPSGVKRDQSIQSKPKQKIEHRKPPVKSASTNELRQIAGADLMHRRNQTTRHLNPIHHLGPVDRTLMLTELNRLMSSQDQGEQIISEAPVRIAPTACIQLHQLRLRSATLHYSHRLPRILALEKRRGGFSALILNSMSGMKGIELMLEHSREHAEMFDRLQRKPDFAITDMDMETAGVIHKDIEFIPEQFDQTLHPPQGLGTKAQGRRLDLNVALEEAIIRARTVYNRDGHIGGDSPFQDAVSTTSSKTISLKAAISKGLDNMVAADDP